MILRALCERAGVGLLLLVIVCCFSAFAQDEIQGDHYGLPIDPSHRFIISHSDLSDTDFAEQALREPRILYNWMLRHPAAVPVSSNLAHAQPRHHHTFSQIPVDWHFPLGNGTIPIGSGPAKYSFDLNQAPNCTNDFVVYALGTAGSPTQPNLIGLNNLYVNSTGTGTCPGTAPNVLFAYNITGAGGNGKILASVGLSLTGTKIAFIESVTSSTLGAPCAAPCSIFHVLTIGTGTGNGSFSNLTQTYAAAVPGLGNTASLTSLVYSNSTNTRSFPFIDYARDVAYFGDDNGNVYKTTCVFQTGCVPALATGYSRGTGIRLITSGANRILTGPVLDITNSTLFEGASDGNVYVVKLANCSGTPVNCTGTTHLAVGKAAGSAGCFAGYGGVLDPPIVDVTFQVWYATAACSGTSNLATMVEGNYSAVAQGTGLPMAASTYNIHSGMPDDNYYNLALNARSISAKLYFPGPNPSGQVVLWATAMRPKNGVGTPLSMTNPPVTTGTPTQVAVPGKGQSEPSTVTIVQNGNADWLFFGQKSVPKNSCNNSPPVANAEGCVFSYNVFDATGASNVPSVITALASEASGTSDIVVDNVSTAAGASSIYFANQSTTTTSAAPTCTTGTGVATAAAYCAVKLTQATLQ